MYIYYHSSGKYTKMETMADGSNAQNGDVKSSVKVFEISSKRYENYSARTLSGAIKRPTHPADTKVSKRATTQRVRGFSVAATK